MSEENPQTPPPPGGVRASDEDRERLVSELNDHAVAGRISTDELEERTQAAYEAKTTAELDALRLDLPVTNRQMAVSHAERRSMLTRRLIQETGGALGVFVLCTGIWVATGASGAFWPVFVLIFVVVMLVRNGWSLYGPAADLDAVEREMDRRREQRGDRHARRRG
jgi:hypothetical protein